MSAPDAAADEAFLRQALATARRAWGSTAPNPLVGAVIVEEGRVVAEGWHERDGGPHAERLALDALGRRPAPGASLYVTLEPCSTAGRTGACTDAILAAGLKRVVVGAIDPNPAHAGRGYAVLREAGVEVITGCLEAECADLNLIFNHWISRRTPLLAGKLAATLDGRTATRTGQSQWITGAEARASVHHWRRLFPAIAVGALTVLKDNPQLTARQPGEAVHCPTRFIFDGLLRTLDGPALPQVYTDPFHERTVVVTTQHGGLGRIRRLRDLGVEVWLCESPTRRVAIAEFRRRCAARRISGVYVEGGAQLLSDLLVGRELDYLFMYQAPVLLADAEAKPSLNGLRVDSLGGALRLTDVRHEVHGPDVLTRGHLQYPANLVLDEAVPRLGQPA